MRGPKEIVARVLGGLGYRLVRLGSLNRFGAMEDTLVALRRNGYRPRVVVDAGANLGAWTCLARRIFGEAEFHLFEPQPECMAVLRALERRYGGIHVHEAAVTSPGRGFVYMVGTGTGAWVQDEPLPLRGSRTFRATTLDSVLGAKVSRDDRVLLKLDLQGHELAALEGGEAVLEATEVIVTEVRFYDIEKSGKPLFADVLCWLRRRGFELYDFAALSPRPRDGRLREGDGVFVAAASPLLADCRWG